MEISFEYRSGGIMHHIINFHPWKNNILNYLDSKRDLVTPDGKKVVITMPLTEFVVTIDGVEIVRNADNVYVSAILDRYEVGINGR